MTTEQKEQLAQEAAYGQEVKQRALDYDWDRGETIRDGFQDGYYEGYLDALNARDEEVEELKEELESLQERYDSLFEGFSKRGTKLGELMKENVKLKAELKKAKNPWISVEERLPDKKKSEDGVELTESEQVCVRTEQVYDGRVYMYYGVAKCYHPTCGGHEWSLPNVTAWMPIPKGGEQ